jgi:hypothetical protein
VKNYRLVISNIMYISNNKARKVVCVVMQHITGILRNQLFFSSLQDIILPENPVRFIDAFVEHYHYKL